MGAAPVLVHAYLDHMARYYEAYPTLQKKLSNFANTHLHEWVGAAQCAHLTQTLTNPKDALLSFLVARSDLPIHFQNLVSQSVTLHALQEQAMRSQDSPLIVVCCCVRALLAVATVFHSAKVQQGSS